MRKSVMVINTLLLLFNLVCATLQYGVGNSLWMLCVFAVLALSASLIYRWQINKILRESELLFGERYLQQLEAPGYGDEKREVK